MSLYSGCLIPVFRGVWRRKTNQHTTSVIHPLTHPHSYILTDTTTATQRIQKATSPPQPPHPHAPLGLGKKVANASDLFSTIDDFLPGETVKVTVLRDDDADIPRRVDISVTLGERGVAVD